MLNGSRGSGLAADNIRTATFAYLSAFFVATNPTDPLQLGGMVEMAFMPVQCLPRYPTTDLNILDRSPSVQSRVSLSSTPYSSETGRALGLTTCRLQGNVRAC